MSVDAGAACCCVRDFAIAGNATTAARARADNTLFRFVFTINLVRNTFFDVRYVAPIPYGTSGF